MKEAAYRNYLLGLLLVILAFNSVDGLTLGLVLQNIKLDLSLSDTQLGFLTGMAFALFYSIMGIPLARWADRGNRVTIITLTTALWSVAVAFCGMAGSFLQLLSIRVAVAVGEAGCIPTATSLIADYFSRAERPRAMARYMLAGPLSCVIGYFLAGWLNEAVGWRSTFALLGLPGLALSVLAWLSLKEPRLQSSMRRDSGVLGVRPVSQLVFSNAPHGLREIFITLWRNGAFRHLLLAYAVMTFCGNGTTQWLSVFFIRDYGLHTGELGTWFAVIYGVGGVAGNFWGGELAARHAAHDERRQLAFMALAFAVSAIVSASIYLAPNPYIAFALLGLNCVCAAMTMGPLFAVIQSLVPAGLRAQAIAIVFLFSNLIGMGLGPLAVGALSDALRPWAGEESLRYALLCLSPSYFWVAWHLWQGSRTVTRDIAATENLGAASHEITPIHASADAGVASAGE